MRHRRSTLTTALVLGVAVATARAANEDKAAIYRAQNERLRGVLTRIPEKYRQRLSAAGRNLLARVYGAEESAGRPRGTGEPDEEDRFEDSGHSVKPALPPTAGRSVLGSSGSFRGVSDPSTDFDSSRLGEFTQNETSTAWCGDVVVVGFNDSGSFGETLPMPGIGLSFNGRARSTNRGRTFTDLGFLNPGPSVDLQLLGDPVVACTDAATFYYASLFLDFGPFTTSVSVSKSANGGLAFADPVKAVEKGLDTHFLDKEWMAADPTNPKNLYVTYTDFDSSGDICGFDGGFPIQRLGIELVKSTDGGQTWGAPVKVSTGAESCTTTGATQGSQVLVDGGGKVHVAWEQFTLSGTGSEIRIARSTDLGATFAASVKVADVNPAGEFGDLQASIRINEFPTLAVDRSGGPRNGTVYLAWNDGSLVASDGFFGFPYGFTDILATRSTDGGATWTSPVRVNSNVEPLSGPPAVKGRGTDQYMPGIAVDRNGLVGICYYDRSGDPLNFLIERRCGRSSDGGAHWNNFREPVTPSPFLSLTNQDFLLAIDYMGDYDTLASDFTKAHRGFVGAYGDNGRGNPDVKANTF